jgi:deoxyribodipyrimidine photo-lyase
MKPEIVIYWSRRDFRVLDNPALSEAVNFARDRYLDFLPIYILDSNILKLPRANIGRNRKQILAYILTQFSKNFRQFRIFCGKPVDILEKIAEQYKIHLFFNDDIEPYAIIRDTEISLRMKKSDSQTHVFKDQMSVNVDTISKSNTIYSVFTPFKNAVLKEFLDVQVYEGPDLDNLSYNMIPNIKLDSIDTHQEFKNLQSSILKKIETKNDSTLYFGETEFDLSSWVNQGNILTCLYTENEVIDKFNSFLSYKILNYKTGRDDLGLDVVESKATSRMSIALKWGLVSARTLKKLILEKYTLDQALTDASINSFISELLWREFYKYILFHYPSSLELEFQPKYRGNIRWVENQIAIKRFRSWVYGQTGYPIVDAAMHQIANEGWMHNRTRMVVASVLTKNLGVDWRWGQEYFRFILADLDEASNNGGWQWAASVGADPKPIRIFNPYLQAEKFDPEGRYQQKWLPGSYNLTEPIIEHSKARAEAIYRYGIGMGGQKLKQDGLF